MTLATSVSVTEQSHYCIEMIDVTALEAGVMIYISSARFRNYIIMS